MHPDYQKRLDQLIDNAIGQTEQPGFISLMAQKSANVRRDIPAAYEMYSLLKHFMGYLSIYDHMPKSLSAGVYFDASALCAVLIAPIPEKMLAYSAHWIADSLHSDEVKSMPGLLCIPFSIERFDELEVLIPEWFSVFYVDGKVEHCIPILTLKSIYEDARFGDWVDVALHRMEHFGLYATQEAKSAVRTPYTHEH